MRVPILSQLVPLNELLASIMDAGGAPIPDHPARLRIDLGLVCVLCIFMLVLHVLVLREPLLLQRRSRVELLSPHHLIS